MTEFRCNICNHTGFNSKKSLSNHKRWHNPNQKLKDSMKGNKNPNWKGGRDIRNGGYILICIENHPRRDKRGYVREHILIMEQKLGRYLTAEEVVHHIDGNPSNNNPINLMLFPNQNEHASYHFKQNNFKRCGDPNQYIRKNNEQEYRKNYRLKLKKKNESGSEINYG